MTEPASTPRRLMAVLSHPEEVRIGLPWAISIAREAGLPLTLLHVIDPVTSRELADNARVMAADMLTLLTTHGDLAGDAVDTRVEMGMTEELLPAVAAEQPDTLLLLAGGEYGAFARTLLGRGRENVIRHLVSPFIFLPPKVGTPPAVERLHRIVLGDDQSGAATDLRNIASALADRRAIEVTTVEVVQPGDMPQDAFLALEPQFDANTIRMRGRPGVALLAAARVREAGLIAVGSHGRGRAFGRTLGSTTQWLSHNADRPVFILPDAARTSA